MLFTLFVATLLVAIAVATIIFTVVVATRPSAPVRADQQLFALERLLAKKGYKAIYSEFRKTPDLGFSLDPWPISAWANDKTGLLDVWAFGIHKTKLTAHKAAKFIRKALRSY